MADWSANQTDGLPGLAKNVIDNKLKSFNVGTMNTKKAMSKKEQEEAKRRMDQEALKGVYEEFVTSFQDSSKNINKTWVKGGMSNPKSTIKGKDGKSGNSSRLYKPASKMADLVKSFDTFKDDNKKEESKPPPPKKKHDKKKSNLELFKEELKYIQEERQERRKVKRGLGMGGGGGVSPPPEDNRKSRFEPPEEPVAGGISLGLSSLDEYKGSITYSDDMSTTNLYLGNLNPQMTEQQLCELFGKHGPLASVKIMWPRTDEERARGKNCGFVAFMNRKDGERALSALQGKDIMEFEMKLGWGKAVPIPQHPVYVPPRLAELTLPPPPSGLPFNAQPKKDPRRRENNRKSLGVCVPPPGSEDNSHSPMNRESRKSEKEQLKEMKKTLSNAAVKVVIPTERPLMAMIHRMIEFVVREGPMFEAMIMNKEMSNPQFRFLFENQSPAHVYYRWKLFSVLQGDSVYKWRVKPFRIFKSGSMWMPPPVSPYTAGMPQNLIDDPMGAEPIKRKATKHDAQRSPSPPPVKRGQLSESQRDRLEDMLRELVADRTKIGTSMVWCLEHAEAAEEIVECVAESLSILQTPLPKKIARLYLISDVLHNCSAKVQHASYYRKFFECKLPEVFKDLHEYYEKIEGRLKAEQFKQRVMACFRAWEDWQVYPNELLIQLQNIFLGLVSKLELEDVDGDPLLDHSVDLDGAPIDGSAIKALVDFDGPLLPIDAEDVDGLPLGLLRDDKPSPVEDLKPAFIKSKWEEVDETQLAQQAVTTSKWDMFEQYGSASDDENTSQNDDLDGMPIREDIDGAPMLDDDVRWARAVDRSRGMSGDGSERRVITQRSRSASPDPKQREQMAEERRAKLREIELKVIKYTDEIESGKRSRKHELTITQQIEHYRQKLLQKEEEKEKDRCRAKERNKDREKVKEWERAREKDRKREERDRDYERGRDRERDRADRDRQSDRRDRSERKGDRSERRKRSESPEDLSESRGSLSMLMRYGRSASRSASPESMRGSDRRRNRSRSASTTPTRHVIYRDSPPQSPASNRKRRRSRSRTPPKSSKRSKSPKKSSHRSPSNTPRMSRRSRTRSRSPVPKSNKKSKKHKRKE